jgi:hypothetical protein
VGVQIAVAAEAIESTVDPKFLFILIKYIEKDGLGLAFLMHCSGCDCLCRLLHYDPLLYFTPYTNRFVY